MAEKASGWDLVTTPADTDIFPLITDIGGTPVNEAMKWSDLVAALEAEGLGGGAPAAGSGSLVFLGSATQSSPANTLGVEFTVPADATKLVVIFDGLELSTQDQVLMQIKQGGSWNDAGYASVVRSNSSSGSTNVDGTNSAGGIKVTNDGATWGLDAGDPCGGECTITGLADGLLKVFVGHSWHEVASANHTHQNFGGDAGAATGVIEGVQVKHEDNGEDMDEGRIAVYAFVESIVHYPIIESARKSDGDFDSVDTSGTWTIVDSGLDLTMPGAVGDRVAVWVNCFVENQAQYINLDMHSMVSSSPVNSWGVDGVVAGAIPLPGARMGTSEQGDIAGHAVRTLVSGDLDSGDLTLRLFYDANGVKTISASGASHLHVTAVNYGPDTT